jgi:hypothetical protein
MTDHKLSKSKIISVAAAVLLCAGGLSFIGGAAGAVFDNYGIYQYHQQNEAMIDQQKSEGKTDILLPVKFDFKTVYNQYNHNANFSSDSNHWINMYMAKYYNVDTITGYMPDIPE